MFKTSGFAFKHPVVSDHKKKSVLKVDATYNILVSDILISRFFLLITFLREGNLSTIKIRNCANLAWEKKILVFHLSSMLFSYCWQKKKPNFLSTLRILQESSENLRVVTSCTGCLIVKRSKVNNSVRLKNQYFFLNYDA